MCRLLGYVAARPTSVIDLLGQDAFDTFTSLAAVHGDGWGMAWHEPEERTTNVATSPVSAAEDARYADLAARALGAAGLVHLRWATGGLAVGPANTHPFTEGGYALAHNGHIAPIDRLEKLLSEDARSNLLGDTDSERYFRFVMQCIAACEDEAAGVTRAIGVLHDEFPGSSLNALLLTPGRLYVVHVSSRTQAPQRLLGLIESGQSLPAGHATEEYFAMAYRVTPDAVHVISSGLTDEGWSAVPFDTAVMIDLATREVTRLNPLSAHAGGGARRPGSR